MAFMKIIVAGGTGFIGRPLVERLIADGHAVSVLSRDAAGVRTGRGLNWDARTQGTWSAEVADADVVINLAGENIADGRWTSERKRRLVDSRLQATEALVTAMQQKPERLRAFVNASAIGFYGPRGDERLDESAAQGTGFLAELTQKWEAAARAAEPMARLVVLRFGIALAADGGALAKMLPPFRLGAGGPTGTGDQWMSWIDRDDVVSTVVWAAEQQTARGVYNVAAPEPVRNRDFTKALGRALNRPALIPTPAFALRLLFGEMADEALLSGQRAVPSRLQAEGFTFAHPELEEALAHAVRG
jgi:uncharacterized protein (TIGR01777 family)